MHCNVDFFIELKYTYFVIAKFLKIIYRNYIMPARNSVEKVMSDLNERGKPFQLSVLEVEHYKNVRQSKIVLKDKKNQTTTKSLEKWREFFDQLKKENAKLRSCFHQLNVKHWKNEYSKKPKN